jgi:hypothetical protein
MLNKEEAIQAAFEEVVPYTNQEVEVQVEEGDDDYGKFVRVHHEGKISSKIRYETGKV